MLRGIQCGAGDVHKNVFLLGSHAKGTIWRTKVKVMLASLFPHEDKITLLQPRRSCLAFFMNPQPGTLLLFRTIVSLIRQNCLAHFAMAVFSSPLDTEHTSNLTLLEQKHFDYKIPRSNAVQYPSSDDQVITNPSSLGPHSRPKHSTSVFGLTTASSSFTKSAGTNRRVPDLRNHAGFVDLSK